MSQERRRRPDADASRFFLGQAQGHQPLEQDHHEMPAAHARVEGFDGARPSRSGLFSKPERDALATSRSAMAWRRGAGMGRI
jgi:hypothetical protein